MRRAAQGLIRTLIDLPELTGRDVRVPLGRLVELAKASFATMEPDWEAPLFDFLLDRVRYVLEQRGFDVRNVRAVTWEAPAKISPLQARRKVEVLPEFTESPDFKQLAMLFKRVRNIAKNLDADGNARGRATLVAHRAGGARAARQRSISGPRRSMPPSHPATASGRRSARPRSSVRRSRNSSTTSW